MQATYRQVQCMAAALCPKRSLVQCRQSVLYVPFYLLQKRKRFVVGCIVREGKGGRERKEEENERKGHYRKGMKMKGKQSKGKESISHKIVVLYALVSYHIISYIIS